MIKNVLNQNLTVLNILVLNSDLHRILILKSFLLFQWTAFLLLKASAKIQQN